MYPCGELVWLIECRMWWEVINAVALMAKWFIRCGEGCTGGAGEGENGTWKKKRTMTEHRHLCT
jgi:hypothetical protein